MSTSITPAVAGVSAQLSPTPPIPTNSISTFLKHHETFLLIVLGFVLFWFVTGKVQDIIAAHDNANLQAATAVLNAQIDSDKKQAVLVAQQAADYKALSEKFQAQNDALARANTALSVKLSERQNTNNNLTLPDLLVRWQQLVPPATLSITNGQATISDTGAHATVNELEKVPVLTEQLANEKTSNENNLTLLSASNKQVSTLNDSVTGLNKQIAAANGVCEEKIKTVKDAAAKSKRRWFVVGYIAGFISRQAIKTYTGF